MGYRANLENEREIIIAQITKGLPKVKEFYGKKEETSLSKDI